MQVDKRFKKLDPFFWFAKIFGFIFLIRPTEWNFCSLPNQTSCQKACIYLWFLFHL